MALLNTTFIFGVLVLLYLSSFLLFAVVRIITGVSIQRIGYLSLRRLAYTPSDGVKVEIRGLGLNLHRPTFAQPTWLSIVLTEPALTLSLGSTVQNTKRGADEPTMNVDQRGSPSPSSPREDIYPPPDPNGKGPSPPINRWEHLVSIKERIKGFHRNIDWIRMVDIVAVNASIHVIDVGNLQVGSFTMAVDTRRRMVDRGRLFTHPKAIKIEQHPVEWMLTIRSILFTPDGGESLEIVDHATLNIHGLLHKELDGLRDACLALKLGRLNIPFDDMQRCVDRYEACRGFRTPDRSEPDPGDVSVVDLLEELDRPGSREEKIIQTVSQSKEFIGSILRGIKEVQLAISFMGLTKSISDIRPRGSPMLYINGSMKEVGIELNRLDQKSPAHRMYFSSKDIAHQALVAALSIAIGVDDGHGQIDRLVYIPMATTTIRTTLPSKTVEFTIDNSADERNANILFANMIITSPSIDLDPKHLPLLLALTQSSAQVRGPAPHRHVLISRLLPKANVKFSMHEPVVRIALPPVEPAAEEDDFDLIISSISSISLDIESSHSAVGELHYSLGSTTRLQSHELYYRTSSGTRYDLLQIESLELKMQMNANPEVCVVATGTLDKIFVHMVRSEISDGVRQIVRQLRITVEPEKHAPSKHERAPNAVRAIPAWLLHFHIQGSDFSAEVAGVDEEISEETRGLALQLESWTAEYRAQKLEEVDRRSSRRRTGSRSLPPDNDAYLKVPTSPKKRQLQHPTDGRRLAIHVRGLEAFIVESVEKWEFEPFLAVPRSEVALSTSSDNQGFILHVNSNVKTLIMYYSLYRHYALGVAGTVLRKAFVRTRADEQEAEQLRSAAGYRGDFDRLSPILPLRSSEAIQNQLAPESTFTAKELITVDFRSTLVQLKAHMPADPALMLQVYGLEAGRHRWSPPFLHAKLARLYAEAPLMKSVWARLISLKSIRVDIRETRRKHQSGFVQDEQMVDINAEAIRLAVPHQLVLHKVFDNFINALKSVQQLHHRFSTGTNEYILDKHPEGPKQVPKISIRSRALLFELEDGAFEWKLGAIYRAGLVEQQQRVARFAAFQMKAKKLEEARRDLGRHRYRSTHTRSRSKQHGLSRQRSKSAEPHQHNSRGPHSHRGRSMRYDPEGTCGISDNAKVSIEEALDRLQRHNAMSWKRRIDRVFTRAKNGMKDLRNMFWGLDELPDECEGIEDILEVPQRPALMGTLISDLHVVVDKPSFPMSQLPDFLHRVGKGMPHNMQYSLLLPMHIQVDMGEARITLRDYPLPLLHVPAIKPGQSSRLPAWSLQTDLVIAEEFRGLESTRHVKVDVVPSSRCLGVGGFAIDVRRTVSPVKSYSDINIDINTGYPTRITWGASYQPAIQDMMMIIETFTKPHVDPSDRVGFWDKIRLGFHSRISVAWKGDGDVHLMLKGSRDPYVVTGNGAGFLMCWRNDVRWTLCREDDPRKFMTVNSGEYILAIPDFSHQARSSEVNERDDASVVSTDSFKRGASFKKVVMKLSGNVQWLAGLIFEREIEGGGRSFDSKPHYEVVMKEPRFAWAPPGLEYDAFRGFRSQHIHMSIAVKAPVDREWSVTKISPSRSYNTVHLTPRFFSHFFSWWSMFGGTMSLPIRQGALWPGIEKSSKKFGRHLATIKYNLLLAPLFLSHIYKHKDAEDYFENVVSATGLKMRLGSFILDLHQRREEFHTKDRGRKTQGRTSGMKLHHAQLDLLSADIRAVSASIAGTTTDDLKKASAPIGSQHDAGEADLSRFDIPDNDFSWIDMDDFVELDWILPAEANPETKIMPLAFAPRFTYFRQTDHGDSISGDKDRTSPFGNEPTHFCIMSKDDDPRRVQCQLMQTRLDQLDTQLESHTRALGEAELKCIRDETNNAFKVEYEHLHKHGNTLRDKRAFLDSMMHRMKTQLRGGSKTVVWNGNVDVDDSERNASVKESDDSAPTLDSNPAAEFASDFDNRFVIHNMQMKWNNLLRNIILRYIHQVSQRRGFVYYLSRRAVKFILDIVEEQSKAKSSKPAAHSNTASATSTPSVDHHGDPGSQDVEDRINEILADGKKFVNADDSRIQDANSAETLDSNISRAFMPQNSYHLRLIAPQIQLQSEKNAKSAVLVTAKGMELKVVEVMDKDRISDDVSGLVQRRFSVEMDSTQFFVTQQKSFPSQLLSMYSGNHYGTRAGHAWPPWVPLEIMFDFQVDPIGFKRVVQKTSASLRYDKYNTLRLKYNDEVSNGAAHASSPNNTESRMDHLWVEFPKVRAICNSSQYYAMYIIVLDLLMYSEPLEKTRTERLEKIMLASDFSDLRGAPEMVICLQERIRKLDELKTQFQIHSNHLDKRGWEDRLLLDRDLTSCEDELFFMMKAITSSQRKYDGSQTSGLLRWNIASNQIVWHLIRDNNEPLMEFQLQRAEYDRTDNSDGSHINLVQIGKIVGLNLLPDAIYPEMFSPYTDAERGAFNEGGNQQMLRVYWYMLEAIAGIPVMDHFEVNLFPMNIKLEREVGKRLFEYVFPGSGDEKSNRNNKSPLMVRNMLPMDDEDDEDDDSLLSTNFTAPEAEEQTGFDAASNAGAGSLGIRLKPTMTSEARANTANSHKAKPGGTSPNVPAVESHHFRMFQSGNKYIPRSRVDKKPSVESLQSSTNLKPNLGRSSTNLSSYDASSTHSDNKPKRFGMRRSASRSRKEAPSDDLTKMMTRASNYMTLAYVKIPSVVLCLSFKGKGDRNIEDVHDFVFRLPMIEYRNKTWSNLDLALALKKDVIRALISHTGAIIGNKFSKHRPNPAQQSRLRQLANSSVVLAPSSYDSSRDNSDASSSIDTSPTDVKPERSRSPRRSFTSSMSGHDRAPSASSSVSSVPRQATARSQTLPASLMMTPAKGVEERSTPSSMQGSSMETPSADSGSRHGFMAHMKMNRLKKKQHDRDAGSISGQSEDADDARRKSKYLPGKTKSGS